MNWCLRLWTGFKAQTIIVRALLSHATAQRQLAYDLIAFWGESMLSALVWYHSFWTLQAECRRLTCSRGLVFLADDLRC